MDDDAHTLVLRDRSAYTHGSFICNLCREKGCGSCFHCSDCQFDLHLHCAATALSQTHFCHFKHPLRLFDLDRRPKICNGCGDTIHRWAFACTICGFFMHSLCVRAPRFILHETHPHPLSLFNAMPKTYTCSACFLPAKHHIYGCTSCGYFLHQSCATIVHIRKHHPLHSEHELRLVYELPNPQNQAFFCDGCHLNGKGWRFSCSQCDFDLHLACAKAFHELPDRSNDLSRDPSGPTVSIKDVEALERVLEFTRRLVKDQARHDPDEESSNEEDICPTCHEGFDSENPKQTTSCGHHFHLPCIYQWMELSEQCPICRQYLVLAS